MIGKSKLVNMGHKKMGSLSLTCFMASHRSSWVSTAEGMANVLHRNGPLVSSSALY